MGVSKGGAAALTSAFAIQRRWMNIPGTRAFAAHAPIVPPCHWVNRNLVTTGAPIYFMLAELDDQTPASQCMSLAEKISKTPKAKIEVRLYKGAHHAWEVLTSVPYYEPEAENFSRCLAHIEDDGRSTSDKDGSTIPGSRKDLFEWVRRNCMTHGTYCCGGTIEQKQTATADLIAFFRRNGF